MNAISSVIGEMIRKHRQGAGLTIEGLAFDAGISPNYLGDVERGQKKPSLDTLEKLLRALGITLQEFFTVPENVVPRRESSKVERIMADISCFTDKELDVVHNVVRQLLRLKNVKK